LNKVHGSLAFYLATDVEIDAYLAEGERERKRCAKSPARRSVALPQAGQTRRDLNAQKQK